MYEVNTSSLDKCKKDNVANIIYTLILIIIFIICADYTIKIEGYTYYTYGFLAIITIVSFILILVTIKKIIAINKRYKNLKYLKNNGKLIKKIPYALKKSDVKRSKPTRRLRIIVLHYTLPTGIKLTLESEPKDDSFSIPKEGFADLLIDENKPDKFFIDMNINRIGGNKEEDYYKE